LSIFKYFALNFWSFWLGESFKNPACVFIFTSCLYSHEKKRSKDYIPSGKVEGGIVGSF
jgi:hypothetical protein